MSEENPSLEELERIRQEAEERCRAYAVVARKPGEEFFHSVKYNHSEKRGWYQRGMSREAATAAKQILIERGFEAQVVVSPGRVDLDQILLYEAVKHHASQKGTQSHG